MMALPAAVAVLLGAGAYLILRRGMMRIVVGFALISHAVNLLIVIGGGTARRRPALVAGADPSVTADPLPQAFVLTAVVIAFAVTIFMLVLAVVGVGDDDTEIELAGRATETPDLETEPGRRRPSRRYPHSDWHAYLDRADDV